MLPAGVKLHSTCVVSDKAVKDRLQQVSKPALQATLIYAPGLQKVAEGEHHSAGLRWKRALDRLRDLRGPYAAAVLRVQDPDCGPWLPLRRAL